MCYNYFIYSQTSTVTRLKGFSTKAVFGNDVAFLKTLVFFASGGTTTGTVIAKDLGVDVIATTGTKLLLIAASTPLIGVIAGGSFVDARCFSLSLLGFNFFKTLCGASDETQG